MRHPLVAMIAATALGAGGTAMAADMPLKAPPPILAYDWSGIYIGGVIGGGWATNDISDPGLGILGTLVNVPVIQTVKSSGFIGGIEGGDRYQFGKLVVGWEADMLWGGINGTSTTTFGPSFAPSSLTRSITANTNWTATSTSSVGIAHDRWLIYGKAGVAFEHTNYTDNWTANIPGQQCNVNGGAAAVCVMAGGFGGGSFPLFSGTGGETRVGWTVGTGIEWAIWNNWSIKAEYDYLDFGSRTVAINGSILPGIVNFPASLGIENSQHINEFKFGVNWHILPNYW